MDREHLLQVIFQKAISRRAYAWSRRADASFFPQQRCEHANKSYWTKIQTPIDLLVLIRTISKLLILSYAGFLSLLCQISPYKNCPIPRPLVFWLSERDFLWSFRKPKYFIGLQSTRPLCVGWAALQNTNDLQPCT
jgi:hypothetical protein